MPPNAMGKTRPVDNPYLIYANDAGFTWRVLKAYTGDPHKRGGRWLLATTSPFTGGSPEYGDGYIADVIKGPYPGKLFYRDLAVPDALIPDPALTPPSPMAGW